MMQIVRNAAEFAGIRHEWDSLYRRSGTANPFISHGWLANWMTFFGQERHVALLARRGGELVGGIVARETASGLVAIEQQTYWNEVLADSDESMALLFSQCARERMPRMEIHGPELPYYRERLSAAARGCFVVVAKNPWVTRRIQVGRSLDEYLAGRESKVRGELRRKLRRFAERAPKTSFECISAARVAEASDIIALVERDSWKHEAGTAINSTAQDAGFYRGILGIDGESGAPALYVLRVDGEPIAFVLGVRHQRRFFALKTSYAQAWSDLSPGLVLFCRLIELLAAEGVIDAIELLGRDSRWKREMASGATTYCVYELLACDVPNRIYSMAHTHVKPLIARLAARAKE